VLRRPWGRYPEFMPTAVIRTLSRFSRLAEEGILVGNGSNELIQASLCVTLGPGRRHSSAATHIHALQTNGDDASGGRLPRFARRRHADF
jgi:hypothetical protein